MPARKQKTKSAIAKATRKSQSDKPVRREFGALILFVLAIFAFLDMFGVRGWLTDWFFGSLRALMGRGMWFLPFALLAGAAVLMFHRGKPVRLRLTCALIIPALMSVLLHLFGNEQVAFSWETVKGLFESGKASQSGGFIGGVIALVLRPAISLPGAACVLIIVLIADIFITLRLSPVTLYDAFRNRIKREYEPEPKLEKEPKREQKPERASKGKAEPAGGHGPVHYQEQDDVTHERESKKAAQSIEFKTKPEHLMTPAELLGSKQADEKIAVPEPVEEISVPEPVQFHEEKPKPVVIEAPAVREPVPLETPHEADSEVFILEPSSPMPYRYPPVTLLTPTRPGQLMDASEEMKLNMSRLVEVLQNFGIGATISHVTRGPSVTRYELELESGVKLSRLTGLADDIALALGAVGVNISPVQEKANVVGVEVPNKLVSTVYIRDLIAADTFKNKESPTSFVIGRDISGQNVVGDIAKLTHLLIAGTTGSGKSVCMNSLITSILYKASPEDVRFIMVDPKIIELGIYNGIPHLLAPVVTDPKKAAEALEWAVVEMERRYGLLLERGKRDLESYNETVRGLEDVKPLPRIIIIIDEMADLMMIARKDVETSIARIAQKARACGVHLVLATQRPMASVVTGIIKANIPSRIAFAVASNLDSRIILDTGGADKLVGRGDMLYLPVGAPKPTRVQGCYISTEEVDRVVEYVKQSGQTQYSESIMRHMETSGEGKQQSSGAGGLADGAEDSMLPAAIEVIIEAGQGSTSFLQRRLKLGYARAARLMDMMEERGIVGPFEGSKPRQVLITQEQWEEMKQR